MARDALGHRFQGATGCHIGHVVMAVVKGRRRGLLIRGLLDAMLATNRRWCAQRGDQQHYKNELRCASQSLLSWG